MNQWRVCSSLILTESVRPEHAIGRHQPHPGGDWGVLWVCVIRRIEVLVVVCEETVL